jgi:hypothetical protein
MGGRKADGKFDTGNRCAALQAGQDAAQRAASRVRARMAKEALGKVAAAPAVALVARAWVLAMDGDNSLLTVLEAAGVALDAPVAGGGNGKA